MISERRLTTRFNTWGGWLTETLMADFQDYVLNVIKTRAEAGR